MKEKLERFIELVKMAVAIKDSPVEDWDFKYNLIFSDEIHGEISKINMHPEYDTFGEDSLEWRARYYVLALEADMEKAMSVLDII